MPTKAPAMRVNGVPSGTRPATAPSAAPSSATLVMSGPSWAAWSTSSATATARPAPTSSVRRSMGNFSWGWEVADGLVNRITKQALIYNASTGWFPGGPKCPADFGELEKDARAVLGEPAGDDQPLDLA